MMAEGAETSVYEFCRAHFASGPFSEWAQEMHLAPDAPEWAICALTLIGNLPVESARQEMTELAAAIPGALRDELRTVLECDLSAQVRTAIVEQAAPEVARVVSARIDGMLSAADMRMKATDSEHRAAAAKTIADQAAAFSGRMERAAALVVRVEGIVGRIDSAMMGLVVAGVVGVIVAVLAGIGIGWFSAAHFLGAHALVRR